MTSIEDFIKVRESIERLAVQIAIFVDRKAVKESRKYLDDADNQLATLRTMVANDTQIMVEDRLSALLGGFRVKIEKMEVKAPARKRSVKQKPEQPVKTEISEKPELVVFEH
ncbi:MAG: hypothetical protein ACYDHW_04780 [Syntrophorhabdaceae bacterium]